MVLLALIVIYAINITIDVNHTVIDYKQHTVIIKVNICLVKDYHAACRPKCKAPTDGRRFCDILAIRQVLFIKFYSFRECSRKEAAYNGLQLFGGIHSFALHVGKYGFPVFLLFSLNMVQDIADLRVLEFKNSCVVG